MRIHAGLAGGLIAICVGCGGQALYNQEVVLAPGDIQPIVVGPFDRDETVTVSVSSSDNPVSVYVFDQDQLEFVDYAVTHGKEPQNVLAGEASTDSTTLTTPVPAKKEIVVRLQPVGKQSARVQLKITK
jgi:hypothetical protein